jgi:DNA-directed RNA polymerase specialized sigma24 family protein
MNDMRHGMRGVLGGIDNELERVNRQLAGYEELLAQRSRLLAARAALTGAQARASGASGRRRISQDEVAAYLDDHPDSLPSQIAQALGVPVTNVSAHLSRGRDTRFLRGGSGWRSNRHTG